MSQQEYIVLAGPADGPQAQGLLPYDIRRQLVMRKFQEIDTNKDGQLDRVELTNHAVKQFLEMDTNKDRFLTEEEFKQDLAHLDDPGFIMPSPIMWTVCGRRP